nr:MAG TPA: hypothetical protein [Caudoviricetes sp.]
MRKSACNWRRISYNAHLPKVIKPTARNETNWSNQRNNIHKQWRKISAAEYRDEDESIKIIRRRNGYAIKRISDWADNPIMICAGAENGGLTWYIDR